MRELGLPSLMKRRLRGILSMRINTWWGSKDCSQIFLICARDNTRCDKHKLKFGKSHKKIVLTVRIAEHWDRFPRQFLMSAFLVIVKTPLDTARNNLVNAGLSREGGSDDLKRSYSTSTILPSVIL